MLGVLSPLAVDEALPVLEDVGISIPGFEFRRNGLNRDSLRLGKGLRGVWEGGDVSGNETLGAVSLR